MNNGLTAHIYTNFAHLLKKITCHKVVSIVSIVVKKTTCHKVVSTVVKKS